MSNDNRCILCGEIIPEGRQVCLICESYAEYVDTPQKAQRYKDLEKSMKTLYIIAMQGREPKLKKSLCDRLIHELEQL